MRKILSNILFGVIVFNIIGLNGIAYAQSGTLLPSLPERSDNFKCVDTYDKDGKKIFGGELNKLENELDPLKYIKEQQKNDDKYLDKILACAIKTGKIHFWMIPHFIVYFIEFMIGLSGLIAILFIVIGGYQLVISGASDQKDNAKNTIKHALMGLVLVLVAWVVVNVVQYIVTI